MKARGRSGRQRATETQREDYACFSSPSSAPYRSYPERSQLEKYSRKQFADLQCRWGTGIKRRVETVTKNWYRLIFFRVIFILEYAAFKPGTMHKYLKFEI